MLILKLFRRVYSEVGTFVSSIYHWLVGDLENNPEIGDVNTDNNANQVLILQPNVPPIPPPLAGLQLFAAIQFPFLQRNRPNLRDFLQPLAEPLSEHHATLQPQLHRGKRCRRETQAENVQAIEKALEQIEMDENLAKQDSKDSIGKPELKDSNDEIYYQTDMN